MNKNVTVTAVYGYSVLFSNGQELHSEHQQDCCESHHLSFEDLSLEDFEGMEFDLNGDFFEKVEGYGIRLKPVKGGFPVPVPGYGYNNGYYSSDMTLILEGGDEPRREWDVSDCQVVCDD